MIKTPVCAALCKRSEILTGDFAAHSHPLAGPLLAPLAIHRICPEAFTGVKEDSAHGGANPSAAPIRVITDETPMLASRFDGFQFWTLSTHLYSCYCAITKSSKSGLNHHFSKNHSSGTDNFVWFRAIKKNQS